jgi:hypothetical protein
MSDIRGLLAAWAAGLVLLLVPAVTPAHAVTFGLTNNITNDSPYVGGQLSVNVQSVDLTHVSFTFGNSGPIASSITDIYFVNAPPVLTGITNIGNHAGVNFSQGANPQALPGGAPFGFGNGDITFSADSNNPVAPNGINSGESLAIVFALVGGKTFGDVIDAMFAQTLRIGIHVQSIAGGDSDSYLATTPLPGALPLFVSGLVSLGFLRLRRKKRSIAAA